MNDNTKQLLQLEAYRQCFESKKHYDILSWTIAGVSIIFIAAVWGVMVKIQCNNVTNTIIIKFTLALISFVILYIWFSIYERNRFWGEVVNELARKIEREANIEGPALAFMKGSLDNKVQLSNTDETNQAYKGNIPREEKCLRGAMHWGVRVFICMLALITILLIFIEVKI